MFLQHRLNTPVPKTVWVTPGAETAARRPKPRRRPSGPSATHRDVSWAQYDVAIEVRYATFVISTVYFDCMCWLIFCYAM